MTKINIKPNTKIMDIQKIHKAIYQDKNKIYYFKVKQIMKKLQSKCQIKRHFTIGINLTK